MLRNLRSRLVLAFTLVSLLALALLAGVTLWYGRDTYLSLKAEQVQRDIENNVRVYYGLHGTLAGLAPQEKPPEEQAVTPTPPTPPHPAATPPTPPPFVVLGSDYRVVSGVTGYAGGALIPVKQRGALVAVKLADRTVAYLLPTGTPPQLNAASRAFLNRTGWALLGVVGLSTLLAALVGAWLARQLLEPLQALRGGVRSLTRGEQPAALPNSSTAELTELSQAFNTMTAELERRRIASRQFSADIAHELGNPLSIMRGTLEAMQDGTLPVTPERLTRLHTQTEYLMHLAGDLRLLSLADAGDLHLKLQGVDIALLLSEVSSAFQAQAQARGVTLSTRAHPSSIQADPLRVTQILHNLVQNALNHTPAGGQITLSADPVGTEWLDIRVQDTGTGIPAEHLPHVFERLYRADPSRSTPGSGLGLSMARTLAQAHGGTLELASQVGQGTAAVLRLPVVPAGTTPGGIPAAGRP